MGLEIGDKLLWACVSVSWYEKVRVVSLLILVWKVVKSTVCVIPESRQYTFSILLAVGKSVENETCTTSVTLVGEHKSYVTRTSYRVLIVGACVIDCPDPKYAPLSALYHCTLILVAPEGTKRQASSFADQISVFRLGGETPSVPLIFVIPMRACLRCKVRVVLSFSGFSLT